MPQNRMDDTIAAIATPLGTGGVAIVRMSGNKAKNILQKLIKKTTITSHKVYHGWIKGIDEVLCVYMRSPKTFTGEDVVEINCHGGIRLVNKILEQCILNGARQAKRGEFTKRAFLNGKMDLSQAEAIISIIGSQTDKGIEASAAQLSGGLSKAINGTRERLIKIAAKLEAAIDFPDDVEEQKEELASDLINAMSEIEAMLETADYGAILKNGTNIAIIGKPNVGKSSLLNALIRQDRAIVADEPGTTRDTIEAGVNLYGLPVKLTDTAGIREPKNNIEQLGIERSKGTISQAEIILLVLDASEKKLTKEDERLIKEVVGKRVIYVLNKVDKGANLAARGVKVSALTGEGVGKLEEAIYRTILDGSHQTYDGIIVMSARHKECLIRAKESLHRAIDSIKMMGEIELQTIDIKEAIESLGEVSGVGVAEEIINNIFNEFCIGK